MSGHKARFTPKIEIDKKRSKCKTLRKEEKQRFVCAMWQGSAGLRKNIMRIMFVKIEKLFKRHKKVF